MYESKCTEDISCKDCYSLHERVNLLKQLA